MQKEDKEKKQNEATWRGNARNGTGGLRYAKSWAGMGQLEAVVT